MNGFTAAVLLITITLTTSQHSPRRADPSVIIRIPHIPGSPSPSNRVLVLRGPYQSSAVRWAGDGNVRIAVDSQGTAPGPPAGGPNPSGGSNARRFDGFTAPNSGQGYPPGRGWNQQYRGSKPSGTLPDKAPGFTENVPIGASGSVTGSGNIGSSRAGKIGLPRSGNVGLPQNGNVGSPGSGNIGSSGSGNVGSPGRGNVGSRGNGNVGSHANGNIASRGKGNNNVGSSPGGGNAGSPETGNVVSPSAGSPRSGNVGGENVGSPRRGNVGPPRGGHSGWPRNGNVGSVKNGNSGSPRGGNGGSPRNGNAGSPGSANVGSSGGGNVRLPERGNVVPPRRGNVGSAGSRISRFPSGVGVGVYGTRTGNRGTGSLGNTGNKNTGKPGAGSESGRPGTLPTEPTEAGPPIVPGDTGVQGGRAPLTSDNTGAIFFNPKSPTNGPQQAVSSPESVREGIVTGPGTIYSSVTETASQVPHRVRDRPVFVPANMAYAPSESVPVAKHDPQGPAGGTGKTANSGNIPESTAPNLSTNGNVRNPAARFGNMGKPDIPGQPTTNHRFPSWSAFGMGGSRKDSAPTIPPSANNAANNKPIAARTGSLPLWPTIMNTGGPSGNVPERPGSVNTDSTFVRFPPQLPSRNLGNPGGMYPAGSLPLSIDNQRRVHVAGGQAQSQAENPAGSPSGQILNTGNPVDRFRQWPSMHNPRNPGLVSGTQQPSVERGNPFGRPNSPGNSPISNGDGTGNRRRLLPTGSAIGNTGYRDTPGVGGTAQTNPRPGQRNSGASFGSFPSPREIGINTSIGGQPTQHSGGQPNVIHNPGGRNRPNLGSMGQPGGATPRNSPPFSGTWPVPVRRGMEPASIPRSPVHVRRGMEPASIPGSPGGGLMLPNGMVFPGARSPSAIANPNAPEATETPEVEGPEIPPANPLPGNMNIPSGIRPGAFSPTQLTGQFPGINAFGRRIPDGTFQPPNNRGPQQDVFVPGARQGNPAGNTPTLQQQRSNGNVAPPRRAPNQATRSNFGFSARGSPGIGGSGTPGSGGRNTAGNTPTLQQQRTNGNVAPPRRAPNQATHPNPNTAPNVDQGQQPRNPFSNLPQGRAEFPGTGQPNPGIGGALGASGIPGGNFGFGALRPPGLGGSGGPGSGASSLNRLLPPQVMQNMALHARLLDQPCGPSRVLQNQYQQNYMRYLALQRQQRQMQQAFMQQRMQQMQQPGQPQSPRFPPQGMPPGLPQFGTLNAPDNPEINYQCTVLESCGNTPEERTQAVVRTPQTEGECRSQITGLLCCHG